MSRHALSVLLVVLVACGARTSQLTGERRSVGALPNVDASTGSSPSPIVEVPLCDERDRNRCGECGPLPEEECNGRDDDCDGTIDEGCVLRIGTLPTQISRVRIAGDYAVLDSGGPYYGTDVVLARISDGTTKIITPHATPLTDGRNDPSREFDSAIGNRIAYAATIGPIWTSPAYELHSQSLAGGDGVLETAGFEPAVDGDTIVFVSRVGGGRDVTVARSDTIVTMATPEFQEHTPDVSGDWIVFERRGADDSPFSAVIAAFNRATTESLILSEGLSGWHTRPAVDGTLVVWQNETGSQAPSNHADVWLYDLAKHTRRALTTGGTGYAPRISGNLVCMATGPYDVNRSIAVMDVSTSARLELSEGGSGCDIDGRRVAWISFRGVSAAYYRDLLPGEP